MVQSTHSPAPNNIGPGAGVADHVNGGYKPAATGATAGIPGTFTPSGATPPASPATMTGIVANPNTAWTSGQYVQTGTAGAAGRATWTGTNWVSGAAPLEDSGAESPKRTPDRQAQKESSRS